MVVVVVVVVAVLVVVAAAPCSNANTIMSMCTTLKDTVVCFMIPLARHLYMLYKAFNRQQPYPNPSLVGSPPSEL